MGVTIGRPGKVVHKPLSSKIDDDFDVGDQPAETRRGLLLGYIAIGIEIEPAPGYKITVVFFVGQ